MSRVSHLRGVRNRSVQINKHGKLHKPSMSGGALKKHLKEDDDYRTNLGMLRHSLKSLNISRPKPKNRYIDF